MEKNACEIWCKNEWGYKEASKIHINVIRAFSSALSSSHILFHSYFLLFVFHTWAMLMCMHNIMNSCGEFRAEMCSLTITEIPYKGGLQANISECMETRREGMKYVSIILKHEKKSWNCVARWSAVRNNYCCVEHINTNEWNAVTLNMKYKRILSAAYKLNTMKNSLVMPHIKCSCTRLNDFALLITLTLIEKMDGIRVMMAGFMKFIHFLFWQFP